MAWKIWKFPFIYVHGVFQQCYEVPCVLPIPYLGIMNQWLLWQQPNWMCKFKTYIYVHVCSYLGKQFIDIYLNVTVWAKPSNVFCTQIELHFIVIAYTVATLNNYVCLQPPLANVNWSAFPKCLLTIIWIQDWWNSANGRF